MNKPHKQTIQFSQEETAQLKDIIHTGTHNARVTTRARILLKSAQGLSNQEIACQLDTSESTVKRVRARYREGRLLRALYDAPRPGQPPKLDDKREAHLVAIACSDPPKGRDHWTLELLQKQMMKDKKVKTISTVAIWNHLHKRGIKPWREKNVVHSQDER